MKGVLYVSHGSRRKKTKQEAIAFLNRVQRQVQLDAFEICFLELSDPDVLEGIRLLIKQGVDKIIIQPVLLLGAGHFFKDIPGEIDKAKRLYPRVSFYYSKPLGVQERLTDVLVDRLEEQCIVAEKETDFLLVGRGSKYPEIKKEIETIAEQLRGRGIHHVTTCYLAALSPTFEEAFETSLCNGRQTVVIPYLWFYGRLFETLHDRVCSAFEKGHEVILSSYMHDHPNMVLALADRVHEVQMDEEEAL